MNSKISFILEIQGGTSLYFSSPQRSERDGGQKKTVRPSESCPRGDIGRPLHPRPGDSGLDKEGGLRPKHKISPTSVTPTLSPCTSMISIKIERVIGSRKFNRNIIGVSFYFHKKREGSHSEITSYSSKGTNCKVRGTSRLFQPKRL